MINIDQELETANYDIRNVSINPFDSNLINADIHKPGESRPYVPGAGFHRSTGIYIGYEHEENPIRLRPKSAVRPVNRFYLHAGRREWSKDDWVRIPEPCWVNDGAAAGEAAKLNNGKAADDNSPFRFMVKRETEFSPIRDYANWAEFRFEIDDWKPLPWADEHWAKEAPAHHFAHVARTDDSMVAYWDSEADAAMDHVTKVSPGRYLKNHFGHLLSNEEIRDWAVRLDKNLKLHFAHTPDEIYEVYTNGPHSCMAYPDDHHNWPARYNAARIYGAGDLAVAYLKNGDTITARALVWPERKAAHRRYGDIERIEMALEAEGYEFDSSGSSAESRGKGLFNGARMLRVHPENYPHNLVMPYLDYGYKAEYIDGDDEFVEMQLRGSIQAQSTNGLVDYVDDDDEHYTCERCDSRSHEDDCTWLGDSVYCDGCYDRVSRCCDRCSVTMHIDDSNLLGCGDRYCNTCWEDHTTSCDYCCEHFAHDNLQAVYDARYEHRDEAEVHTDACGDCIRSHESIQQDVNGLWIDVDTATHCSTCHEYFSSNIDEEECPSTTCVAARAEEELEPAE